MKANRTILTILILLLFKVSHGQVEKIKFAKEKINILGLWDAFSPDTNIASGPWYFLDIETEDFFIQYDTITGNARASKYFLDKNILTITFNLRSQTPTKFSLQKMGDKLKLKSLESNPPTSSKIKTIILTKKHDKRIDSNLTLD